MRKEILACVELEDLQDELLPIVERLGIDAVRVLLEEWEGMRVELRSYSKHPSIRQRFVRNHYKELPDGNNNVIELARKLGIRPRLVREYIKKNVQQKD